MTQYLYKRVLSCELESPSGEKWILHLISIQTKLLLVYFFLPKRITLSIY
jgi:hypothetical protein